MSEYVLALVVASAKRIMYLAIRRLYSVVRDKGIDAGHGHWYWFPDELIPRMQEARQWVLHLSVRAGQGAFSQELPQNLIQTVDGHRRQQGHRPNERE